MFVAKPCKKLHPNFYSDLAHAKKNSTSDKVIIPSYHHQNLLPNQNNRQTRLFVLKKKRVNFPDESSTNKINDLLISGSTKGSSYTTTAPTNGNAKVIMIDTLPGRLDVFYVYFYL